MVNAVFAMQVSSSQDDPTNEQEPASPLGRMVSCFVPPKDGGETCGLDLEPVYVMPGQTPRNALPEIKTPPSGNDSEWTPHDIARHGAQTVTGLPCMPLGEYMAKSQ